MKIISFQNAIAMHESNGIDIIIALVLSEISMDLVLELKVCTAAYPLDTIKASQVVVLNKDV